MKSDTSRAATTSQPERRELPGPKPPSIELPKGGGAVRAIGEKLNAQAVTGTNSVSIPLPASPGRGGLGPSASLDYDSGAGNGPFGIGWTLAVPSIRRRTDKRLPEYEDARESDVFVLSGSEDLVPQLVEVGAQWVRDERTDGDFRVQRYRPRVEGLFARIERWTHTTTGEVHWRSTTRENVTSVYGSSPEARIADPADPRRVFEWLLEETRDDRGNVVAYTYIAEDAAGVDPAAPEEAHRLAPGAAFAQRYLKRVRYTNDTPGVAADFHFELVFDYGDHDLAAPTPTADAPWPCREDPFSSYRAGFEVRTYRLCRRVLMFHRFTELGATPCLVRALELTYDENPVASRLTTVGERGYVRDSSGVYSSLALPQTEFGYIPRALHGDVKALPEESLEDLPAGLRAPEYQWVDLDGEGLSGVLTEQAGAWWYKRNDGNGELGPAQLVASHPSMRGLATGDVTLADVGAAGPKRLITTREPTAGFFDRDDEGRWGPFVPFEQWPDLDLRDPHVRHIDLDGDGEPDLLVSRDEMFVWYPSRGARGYGPPRIVGMPADETRGPRIVFADALQTIFLADMSGDGQADIVRVRNGEVCYWPNLGHGRFGARVAMGNAPVFEEPDLFEASRVRLADIDGSGPSDVIYLGRDGVRVWFNQAGNDWSAPETIAQLPRVDEAASIQVLDLLGHGTTCLVWSSPLPGAAQRALWYVDLMGGQKPHLLASVRNNLGKETRYAYAPSTRFYVADRRAGRPWVTRLPFPVWVVERCEVRDGVTGSRLVSRYAYHHGYYDRAEREFRGFGLVEQWDTESFEELTEPGLFPEPPTPVDPVLYAPPVRTKTWFHTGAYFGADRIAKQYEAEYYAGDAEAMLLPDTVLPAGLSAEEQREACRALRGAVLRTEVYGLDGASSEAHPYSVAEQNYALRVLQPIKAGAPHAVFLRHAREVVTYHYERNPADPRVAHAVTLSVDDFGTVLQSVEVAYPRRVSGEPEQAERVITCAETSVLHYADDPAWYRVGVPLASASFEVHGVGAPVGGRYTFGELADALAGATEIAYEATPSPSAVNKRVLARTRQRYWADDLSAPLAFGAVESRALPHKTYALALTPGLVTAVYGTRVTTTMLETEGGYVELDDEWWAPSAHQVFDAARFYVATSVVDAVGHTASAAWDAYALLIEETTDPVGNTTSATNDYRVLAPAEVTDANGNRTAVAFDARGVVVAMAVMGKVGAGEGDTLADPTATFDYYPFDWVDALGPVRARARRRERHGDANSPWQESHTFWDGFGRVVQTKAQAEPGLAPSRDANGDVVRDTNGDPVLVDTSPALRWVGSGRTVFNNKGAAVKQYEPFFSVAPDYEDEEDIVHWGVTPVLHHDPLGRVVRTDLPDGTYAKVVFTPWEQAAWDASDTVLDSAWYAERIALPTSDPAYRAATLSAAHAGTPTVTRLDSRGRAVLARADNGSAGVYATRTTLDVAGHTRAVTDARSITCLVQDTDLAGQVLRSASTDAGERFVLYDVLGRAVRTWSARGFVARFAFDAAGRTTHHHVTPPSGSEVLVERAVYGEAHATPAALNLRGRLYQQYDGAGVVTNAAFDFAGNCVEQHRRYATAYATAPDWSALASLTSASAIEAAASALLEAETFTTETAYDALARPTSVVTWDASDARPAYNEAGLFAGLAIYLRGAASATTFVSDVDYDAKGRRARIEYGNGVETTYTYDAKTFRLRRLRTTRDAGADVLQNLAYTFDAVGDIVEIRDTADQPLLFTNSVVAADQRFAYDAVHRLVSAEGREHPGTVGEVAYDHTYGGRATLAHPNDGSALRRYDEAYEYDAVGNLLRVLHQAGSASWSRRYAYASGSNRLLATSLPGDDPAGPYSATYAHDAAGNMTAMPHLAAMDWTHDEKLREVDLGGGGTAYYAYDAAGQRVRKVIERTGTLREERLYPGGPEVYREWSGSTLELERETLRVMDDTRAIAEVDTLTVDGGTAMGTSTPMPRYQLENHLGSACLEVDGAAAIIAYEEYYPYGATAFESRASGYEVPARRYRYTGMERDEESGLQRHGVRYYAPWLARWTSADPAGITSGIDLYAYSNDSAISAVDRTGLDATPAPEEEAAGMSISGGRSSPRGAEQNTVPLSVTPVDRGSNSTVRSETPHATPGLNTSQLAATIGERLRGATANSAMTSWDTWQRTFYYQRNRSYSARAIQRIVLAERANDLVEARAAAEEASGLRNQNRTATQRRLTPGGRALSQAVEEERQFGDLVARYAGEHGEERQPSFRTYRAVGEAVGRGRSGPLLLLTRTGRVLGPLGTVAGSALIVREVVNAPSGQRLRTGAVEAGGIAGGAAGSTGGSLAGLVMAAGVGAGPVGTVALAAVGTLAGGGGGASAGRSVVEFLWSLPNAWYSLTHPAPAVSVRMARPTAN